MSSSSKLSFTEHPATVGETYAEHLQTAMGFSMRMIAAGLACLVHGFFPFLFERTGSVAIRSLHERMIINRARTDSVSTVKLVSGQVEGQMPADGSCTGAS